MRISRDIKKKLKRFPRIELLRTTVYYICYTPCDGKTRRFTPHSWCAYILCCELRVLSLCPERMYYVLPRANEKLSEAKNMGRIHKENGGWRMRGTALFVLFLYLSFYGGVRGLPRAQLFKRSFPLHARDRKSVV